MTTSITSGSLDDYERRPPSAVTTHCDAATGRIGSLVFVPSDDDRAELAIRIVTARNDRSPDLCLSGNVRECIVARRVVRFVPHRTLRLTIPMQQACSGVACPDGETCVAGECAPAFVSAEELEPSGDHDPTDEEDAIAPPPTEAGAATDAAPSPVAVDAGRPVDAGQVPVRDGGRRDSGAADGGQDKPTKPVKPGKDGGGKGEK